MVRFAWLVGALMMMGCAVEAGDEDVTAAVDDGVATKDVLAMGPLKENRGIPAPISGPEDSDGRCGNKRQLVHGLPTLERVVDRQALVTH